MSVVSNNTKSLAFGFLGILGFSLTLPATRVAVVDLDPTFVGLGRGIVAAGFAAVGLIIARSSFPNRRQWFRLAATAMGVVIGFPLLSAMAMETVPASHGAVIVGLTPLTTALFGVWLARERPSPLYWAATIIGSAVIVTFALVTGAGSLQIADMLLLGAIVSVGFGYAEGARLSKELGAWQTISWALLVSVPALLYPVILTAPTNLDAVSGMSLLGFGYVSVVSMYLAFFAWYKGLAMGGIARIGQLQLLQPFITMIAASQILHEVLQISQIIVAIFVLGCVIVARRSLSTL
jgi:drug/metabolite transporter (DMT)-like permease